MEVRRSFARIDACWAALAARLLGRGLSLDEAAAAGGSAVEEVLFASLCRRRDVAAAAERAGWIEPPARLAQRHGLDESELRPAAASLDETVTSRGADTSPELLGEVHQRLLGRRLARSRSGKLAVRTRREPRRARGAYYTPDYLAQYIAGLAVSTRLENRGDAPPEVVAIVDPSCGGGAFLIAAARTLRRRGVGAERTARSLYGMDVDPAAVRAAQRAVWLEIVAGERSSPQSLPDAGDLACLLAERIVCRDALADETAREFAGRFDVVLGNPPYLRELDAKPLFDRIAGTELGRSCRAPRMDLCHYFLYRGLELLRPGGVLSFLLGAYWTAGRASGNLIALLRDACRIDEVFLLDRLKVFPGLSGRHLVLSVSKGSRGGPTRIKRPKDLNTGSAEPVVRGVTAVECFWKTPGELFRDGRLDLEPPDPRLAALDRWPALGGLGAVRQGIAENPAAVTGKMNARHGNRWQTGEGVFALTPEEVAGLGLSERERDVLRPYHDLCDLGRYDLAESPSRVLVYATAQTWPEAGQYPTLRDHLARFRPILESRRETRLGRRAWWQLHWPRDEAIWQGPKVIAVQMGPRPAFVPAAGPVYVPFSVNVFVPDRTRSEHLNYFAAVLNSRLLCDWYRRRAKRRGVGLEINGHLLARTPVRTIDFARPADVARHDRLVALVDEMLAIHRGLRSGPDVPQRAELERRRTQVDAQIDAVVEDLYGVDRPT